MILGTFTNLVAVLSIAYSTPSGVTQRNLENISAFSDNNLTLDVVNNTIIFNSNIIFSYTYQIEQDNLIVERGYTTTLNINCNLTNFEEQGVPLLYENINYVSFNFTPFYIDNDDDYYYLDIRYQIEVELEDDQNINYWSFDDTENISLYKSSSNISSSLIESSTYTASVEYSFYDYRDLISGSIYNEAYQDGYDVGRDIGYDEGYNNGYSNGYSNGYDEGNEDGYDVGYDEGYDVGYDVGNEDGYQRKYLPLDIIKKAIDIVVNIFSLQILPGVPLAVAFGVPLVLSIVFFVLRLFR